MFGNNGNNMALEDTDALRLQLYFAGNSLNLDSYLNGVDIFLHLLQQCWPKVATLENLRLGTNVPESSLAKALSGVCRLYALRSLAMRGGIARNDHGAGIAGSLVRLPDDIFSNLCHLTHLELSCNRLISLPPTLRGLTSLSILFLANNSLQELPDWLGQLRSLTRLSVKDNHLCSVPPSSLEGLSALCWLDLSNNRLETLPEELGSLHCLEDLDVSRNSLASLPASLSGMNRLKSLFLHDNRLISVPASLASLPALSRLDLCNNSLRFVPPEVAQLPFTQLKGNPIGRPETPPLHEKHIDEPKMIKIKLLSDHSSMTVGPGGLLAWLPCGVRLRFPAGAVDTETSVTCDVRPPDPTIVRLNDHELLLSSILVLQPHGITFGKEVDITVPYEEVQDGPKREAVMRTFDCNNWSNLETKLKRDKNGCSVAQCSMLHFSYFLVVARLVEDSCSVPPEGTQLFSSVNPGVHLLFPPGAVEETRQVRMQVLPVDDDEMRQVVGDETMISPVLILSQSPASTFLKPVKIRLPLPPGVSGFKLDPGKLHVLHGDPHTGDWEDITRDLKLEFTYLYAIFEVSEFSLYWLWYMTQDYVGTAAKKAYELLRRWRVCFLAMQLKRDPELVLLRCLPYKKVDPTLKTLRKKYIGPQPSEMVEILEGEEFYAAFEGGIEVHTDLPRSSEGRLAFVFYAKQKNMKEVYVKSQDSRERGPVKGQVSFYRGELPTALPEEAVGKRKGPDSTWLATLPIKLPKVKADGRTNDSERSASEESSHQTFSFPPLDLGNPETGYLTETNLRTIASRIGLEWHEIGTNLGLKQSQLERIKYDNSGNLDQQIMKMLVTWARGAGGEGGDAVSRLIRALKASNRTDLSEEVASTVELGRQKYQAQLSHSNLDQQSSASQ
uniref:P53-induced death domain-containing protein 1 n=1 Tax=Petromyzon marinus TaxID=7757 RepID=A0AAJ7TDM5_PETMA|nr:p53-induced death domain-containing protein 1 [Petromyzon marinus]XP_032815904.1 p53-induced death domain-containing protein 1 [Petromyzon marinus]